MERICIAALTYFNVLIYHTADSNLYFCCGNSATQLKFYYMVKQTPVLVKVDSQQLESLDRLCSDLNCKRNKMINFAIYMVNMFMVDDLNLKFRLTSQYQECLDVFNQVR